jgi:hypothetical protein
MAQIQATQRWILEWEDRSGDPDRRVLISSDSVQEVRDDIRRILEGEEWTPPDADEIGGPLTEPAFDAFVREEFDFDSDDAILDLWSAVSFECDDGVFSIIRER